MKKLATALAFTMAATPALADDFVSYPVAQSYSDTVFSVENAILDKGLVIDNISHVGQMLARTGADVGSGKQIFDDAQVFNFCSASTSRKVMEADPANIAFCPYGIFVYSLPGNEQMSYVGYRTYPAGPMKEVQGLLEEIVQDALDF